MMFGFPWNGWVDDHKRYNYHVLTMALVVKPEFYPFDGFCSPLILCSMIGLIG
jgi:hypothetical protein